MPKLIRVTPCRFFLIAACTVANFPAIIFAQNHYWQESAKIFNSSSVAIIKIEIASAFLNYVLDPANAESDSLFPARLIFQNAEIPADTLEPVGFRLRGNTSRRSQKKSFKLDLNEYVKGQKLYGLEKLNINGEHNDPAILRALLSWRLFNQYQVPAARATYTALYINGEYKGLYIIVEHYDEEFLPPRFGNNEGNLYKCLYPADLVYLGADQAAYKKMRNSRERAYDLETNEDRDDYSDLVEFITFLNNANDADFGRGIEERFNVRAFLKYLAVNTLIGSWDDYWYLKNNFYLYHNTATGKFEFIPYDYDNTYGVDFVGGDWGRRDLYAFGHPSEPRPLVTRILAIPGYRNLYSAYLKEVMANGFALAQQEPAMLAWRNIAEPWVRIDTYYPRDWNFTFNDWQQALDVARGGHVKYGIKNYIATRIATATQQLREGPVPATISDVQWQPMPSSPSQEVTVTCRIVDAGSVAAAELLYTVSGGPLISTLMFDDGQHGDGAANDGRWAAQIPAGTLREFYLRVRGSAGAWTIYPETAPFKKVLLTERVAASPLVINEFMASNSATIRDPAGEPDDWVEIYNPAATPIRLVGFFLTDNLANPTKWQFPDTTLAANGFMLLWADDQAAQGSLHMTFRLSADGEQLGIFAPQNSGTIPIDTLSFGAQTTDVSSGRATDAGASWKRFEKPTPGVSNNSPTRVVETGALQNLTPKAFYIESLLPNPAGDATQIRLAIAVAGVYTIRLFDVTGREVERIRRDFSQIGLQTVVMPLTNLRSGIYFLRMEGRQTAQAIKLIVLRS